MFTKPYILLVVFFFGYFDFIILRIFICIDIVELYILSLCSHPFQKAYNTKERQSKTKTLWSCSCSYTPQLLCHVHFEPKSKASKAHTAHERHSVHAFFIRLNCCALLFTETETSYFH